MAYKLQMKRYNSAIGDFDLMYPRTKIEQVAGGQRQIITALITIPANWTVVNEDYATQSVNIAGVTASTKIDLQADIDMTLSMGEDGCTGVYIVNNGGTCTAYAIGNPPPCPQLHCKPHCQLYRQMARL